MGRKTSVKAMLICCLTVLALGGLWIKLFGFGEVFLLQDEDVCGRTRHYVEFVGGRGPQPKYNMAALSPGQEDACRGQNPHIYSDPTVIADYRLSFSQWRHLKRYHGTD